MTAISVLPEQDPPYIVQSKLERTHPGLLAPEAIIDLILRSQSLQSSLQRPLPHDSESQLGHLLSLVGEAAAVNGLVVDWLVAYIPRELLLAALEAQAKGGG